MKIGYYFRGCPTCGYRVKEHDEMGGRVLIDDVVCPSCNTTFRIKNIRKSIKLVAINTTKMSKPTAIEKDWEKELKQVLNCDAFSNSCVVDEKELRQFISNLLSKQRKELIEKDVIKND